jgi:hypothetical protein
MPPFAASSLPLGAEAAVRLRSVSFTPNRSKGASIMDTKITNATEYRNLPLAMLTESTTNPRRLFEENALRELADFVPGHKIGFLFR